jgi:hypothetical protein
MRMCDFDVRLHRAEASTVERLPLALAYLNFLFLR